MIKIGYLLIFFINIIVYGQANIDLKNKEKYKLKYDSTFIKTFGKRFFEKNILYNKEQSFVNVDTLDGNSENYVTTKDFYVNDKNIEFLSKFSGTNNNTTYMYFYAYSFIYKSNYFYQDIYRFDSINNDELLNYDSKKILEYYNNLKNNIYVNPKKILKLAKSNGLKNICYQSLTEYSDQNKGKTVWVIKACDSDKKIRILEADPKSGKLLSLYNRNYFPSEKAAYWNDIKWIKEEIFISSKQW